MVEGRGGAGVGYREGVGVRVKAGVRDQENIFIPKGEGLGLVVRVGVGGIGAAYGYVGVHRGGRYSLI